MTNIQQNTLSRQQFALNARDTALPSLTRELRPAPQHRHVCRAPVSRPDTDTILAAFNTWAYKREQPDSREKLLATVNHLVDRQQPLSFVMYWGKGPRAKAGKHEASCLEFLSSMQERVEQVYAPGVDFTLVFTDTHADLNGHTAAAAEDYFGSVEALPQAGRYSFARLTDVVRKAPPLLRASEAQDASIDPVMLRTLLNTAAKWYSGPGTVEDGARRYYQANMVERRAIEFAYPHAIFVSFNGRESRPLFPDSLPIFYMYSLRKGFSVKPWFIA